MVVRYLAEPRVPCLPLFDPQMDPRSPSSCGPACPISNSDPTDPNITHHPSPAPNQQIQSSLSAHARYRDSSPLAVCDQTSPKTSLLLRPPPTFRRHVASPLPA